MPDNEKKINSHMVIDRYQVVIVPICQIFFVMLVPMHAYCDVIQTFCANRISQMSFFVTLFHSLFN